MEVWQTRTEMLLGATALERLEAARVAVVGLGGVGAMAAEMLARAGVGHLVLVDSDVVSESNINRQLPALHSTVGALKCDVVRARLLDINPALEVACIKEFICEENIPSVLGGLELDCVVDCIDTLSPKIALVQHCLGRGVHLVSSMGSGAKTDATRIRVDDISRTIQCPLARMLRKRLHKLGIESGFTAVYSTERPRHDAMVIEETRNKKSQTGTVSYLPAAFGCVCAQVVVQHIVSIEQNS
ncbi:MAG: tRNA threonylcarbamoyladenosine dehydratase [Bacteroidales bacterium]|nr:tRNA threonylcarbamoyladenosine dehydratase [Bacteroidales bacterium]